VPPSRNACARRRPRRADHEQDAAQHRHSKAERGLRLRQPAQQRVGETENEDDPDGCGDGKEVLRRASASCAAKKSSALVPALMATTRIQQPAGSALAPPIIAAMKLLSRHPSMRPYPDHVPKGGQAGVAGARNGKRIIE
jgi:hypothetical protein